MTPHRYHGRGTLVIDRQFAGIGRIRRASGTTDPLEVRAINDLLTTLYRRRRLDYLAALRDGLVHPFDLLLRVQQLGMKDLDTLPAPQALAPIAEQWTAWVEATARANTRRMYALAWRHLAAHLPTGATLGDLAPALLQLRTAMQAHAPSFNRTRASVQAFVKSRVGTRHPAYTDLEGVEKLRERAARREGLPIADVIAIRNRLPADAGAVWWQLAVSGMRVGELYGLEGASWTAEGNLVRIRGTKTDNADRVVPRLAEMVTPAAPLRKFRAALRLCGVTPHIARYSFKVFAEDAGLPVNRVEQYLGRSAKGMDGLYSRVQLAAWIEQDRPVLLAYLAAAEQAATADRRAAMRRA